MTKKARLKKHKSNNGLDCISQLPDEILVNILSLLTMKEAARTSVLSSRWMKLWTSILILDFDGKQTLNEVRLGTKSLETERKNYVSWVNQVVKSHKGTRKIHKFRIRFDLDTTSRRNINRWVKFAIKKDVKMLELDLRDRFDCGFINNKKKYPFPFKYYPKQLQSLNIGFPCCNCLTTLRLTDVKVTGEAVDYFLCNCPFLECLYVAKSDCLVDLKVAGPLLRLKHLDIRYCFKLKIVEISAVNLISFKYFGPKISMPFKCAPLLVELLIGGSYSQYLIHNSFELSHYLYQIEALTLYVSSSEGMMVLVLTNLKQLQLLTRASHEESLLGFTSLIEASPFLHRFVLQVVEFTGFVGQAADVELAMYIIENAVKLEKIVFDPGEPNMIGTPWELEETKRKRMARRRAQKLRLNVDPRINFVIL